MHIPRYPVAYTVLLLPVTIARFVMFSGRDVPFGATIFADFIFNLQGVANVILLLATRRLLPDTETLPIFSPRKRVSVSSPEAFGITPFVLPPPEVAISANVARMPASAEPVWKPEDDEMATRPMSTTTIGSINSRTLLFHDRR